MEAWLQVLDYTDYFVSSYGQVRSYKNGRTKILKQDTDKRGFKRVSLLKSGVTRKFLVHRLVAIAFIGNLYGKEMVSHIDDNYSNNNVDNLQWRTTYEIGLRGHRAGLQAVRAKMKTAHDALTDDDIGVIRRSFVAGTGSRTLAKYFGIGYKYCDAIINNKERYDKSYSPPKRRFTLSSLLYKQFVKQSIEMRKQFPLMGTKEIAIAVGATRVIVTGIINSPAYQEWYDSNCVNSGEA